MLHSFRVDVFEKNENITSLLHTHEIFSIEKTLTNRSTFHHHVNTKKNSLTNITIPCPIFFF